MVITDAVGIESERQSQFQNIKQVEAMQFMILRLAAVTALKVICLPAAFIQYKPQNGFSYEK